MEYKQFRWWWFFNKFDYSNATLNIIVINNVNKFHQLNEAQKSQYMYLFNLQYSHFKEWHVAYHMIFVDA